MGIIAAGAVVTVAAFYLIGPSVSTSRNFAPYSTPVSQNAGSAKKVSVVDVNGDVSLTGWSQSYVLVNGTVTARGIGSNPDAITFIESNSSGNIVFEAVFPPNTFYATASYTVGINVYLPSTQLNTVEAVTVNGNLQVASVDAATNEMFTVTNGGVSVSGVTTANLSITDTNGNVNLSCSSSCGSVTAVTTNGGITADFSSLALTGSYSLTSTNGSIGLKVPASGSFKITANTTNGSVSSSGLAVQLVNHAQSTVGAGTATMVATTTNGSVTVTGV